MRCCFLFVIHGELTIKNDVFLQCDSIRFCKPVYCRTGTCDNRSSMQPHLLHRSPHLQLKRASTISPATQTPTCPMGSPVSRMLATISPSTWAIYVSIWNPGGLCRKLSHGPTQRCEPCEPGVARVPISFPAREWKVQQTSDTFYNLLWHKWWSSNFSWIQFLMTGGYLAIYLAISLFWGISVEKRWLSWPPIGAEANLSQQFSS